MCFKESNDLPPACPHLRAADASAEGYVVCYTMDRKAFDNLLGPIEDVWRYEALRKVPLYIKPFHIEKTTGLAFRKYTNW